MVYKNYSYTDKTFYGVTFKPGEIKETDKIIDSKWVRPIDKLPESKKAEQQKPSPEPLKDAPALPVEAKEVPTKSEEQPEEKSNKGKKS